MLKYLFFLVLGIIIYILLNDKDRFSIGIQEGGQAVALPYLDHFPDWPDSDLLSSPRIYHIYERKEVTDTEDIIFKYIKYMYRTLPKLQEDQCNVTDDMCDEEEMKYGIKIIYKKKVCAACKNCCTIEDYGSAPSSILDYLKIVSSTGAPTNSKMARNIITNANNRDKLLLNRPLVYTGGWGGEYAGKPPRTDSINLMIRPLKSAGHLWVLLNMIFDPSFYTHELIFYYSINIHNYHRDTLKNYINLSPNNSQLFLYKHNEEVIQLWATIWDPVKSRSFWDALLFDLKSDVDCDDEHLYTDDITSFELETQLMHAETD